MVGDSSPQVVPLASVRVAERHRLPENLAEDWQIRFRPEIECREKKLLPFVASLEKSWLRSGPFSFTKVAQSDTDEPKALGPRCVNCRPPIGPNGDLRHCVCQLAALPFRVAARMQGVWGESTSDEEHYSE